MHRHGGVPKMGLSNIKKVPCMIIRRNDYANGEWTEFEVNPLELRIGRQRKRVHGFCDLIDGKDFDLLMITLTYRTGEDFGLRDVTDFIRRLKRRVRIHCYTWVLEMQARGVPHYHLIIAVDPKVKIPLPDKSGLWNYGMTRVEKARSVWYVASYTGKEYQKQNLPKYFHMYCVWVSRRVLQDTNSFKKILYEVTKYPKWVSDIILSRGDWLISGRAPPVRKIKSGWEIDGMDIPSPYQVVSF